MVDAVLKWVLAEVGRKGGADGGDLDQYLRAVPVCFNHGLNGIGMADDPRHPVYQPGIFLR